MSLLYRLFLLFLLTYFTIKILRRLFKRTPTQREDGGSRMDQHNIRDAEFTEVRDPEEGQR